MASDRGANYRIAVLPGDGIGPEVIVEARETLELAARLGGFGVELGTFEAGGAHYLATGVPMARYAALVMVGRRMPGTVFAILDLSLKLSAGTVRTPLCTSFIGSQQFGHDVNGSELIDDLAVGRVATRERGSKVNHHRGQVAA